MNLLLTKFYNKYAIIYIYNSPKKNLHRTLQHYPCIAQTTY